MIEKIKNRWKEILIGILTLFSINKCTQSCNRQSVINSQKIELKTNDSVIKSQSVIIDKLNDTINIYKERINTANANTAVAKANEQTAIVKEQNIKLRNKLNKK